MEENNINRCSIRTQKNTKMEENQMTADRRHRYSMGTPHHRGDGWSRLRLAAVFIRAGLTHLITRHMMIRDDMMGFANTVTPEKPPPDVWHKQSELRRWCQHLLMGVLVSDHILEEDLSLSNRDNHSWRLGNVRSVEPYWPTRFPWTLHRLKPQKCRHIWGEKPWH